MKGIQHLSHIYILHRKYKIKLNNRIKQTKITFMKYLVYLYIQIGDIESAKYLMEEIK